MQAGVLVRWCVLDVSHQSDFVDSQHETSPQAHTGVPCTICLMDANVRVNETGSLMDKNVHIYIYIYEAGGTACTDLFVFMCASEFQSNRCLF